MYVNTKGSLHLNTLNNNKLCIYFNSKIVDSITKHSQTYLQLGTKKSSDFFVINSTSFLQI